MVAGPIATESVHIYRMNRDTTIGELALEIRKQTLDAYLGSRERFESEGFEAKRRAGKLFVVRFEYGSSRTMMGTSHRIRSLAIPLNTGGCDASLRFTNDGVRMTASIAACGFDGFPRALRKSIRALR
jgi:hypothetical protein